MTTDAELDRLFRQKYGRRRAEARAAAAAPRGRPPRFTPEVVAEMRAKAAAGASYGSLALAYRCSRASIQKYVRDGFQPMRWAA